MPKLPLLLFTWLMMCSGLSWGEPVFSMMVPPDHDAIRYVGRFTEDYRSQWTGSRIEMRFQGSGAAVHLEVPAGKQVAYAVIIDGEASLLIADDRRTVYLLAEGLDSTVMHDLILFRRSEAFFGEVKFLGFEFPENTRIAKMPMPERRMLVIGDSITCGYGNEATDVKEGNTLRNENGWLAYAPLTARHFNADLVMLCWSGRGLYRNRAIQNDTQGTLPKFYTTILPEGKATVWDARNYVPEVVVINLGTNDSNDRAGQKTPLSREDYVNCYQDFIRQIRKDAPDCIIFLTLGPMNAGAIREDWLQAAAAPFDDVHVFLYKDYAGAEDLGGHYHPSVIKHQKMSEELIREINAHGPWQD